MTLDSPSLHQPSFTSRIVPVIVITDVMQAVPLAHALLAGGVDVMEITLRHPAGLAAIEAVARQVPQMQVGAGTVTRAREMARALPFIPGVMTPGEVLRAREHGFGLLKLFPAEQAGGVGMLKALAGPLPEMRFCPTGGVSPSNLAQYLQQPNVAMVGGSWLTPAAALEQGRWQDITDLAAQATALAAAQ
jgi:2-dehydro-3-deoxyphosphogluconate aldolase/(4S)-4-hydroxy-2-oxoglutarate aldolase